MQGEGLMSLRLNLTGDHGRLAGAVHDPLSMTAAAAGTAAAGGTGLGLSPLGIGSLAASGIGTALSAAGTLAGGAAARRAGLMQQAAANYQADQAVEEGSQEFAAAQRSALDKSQQTRLAISSSRAQAAGSGTDAGVGSPVANEAALATRGQYLAQMDLWRGANAQTGELNRAAGLRYTGALDAFGGREQQSAASLAAMGTIAGGAGNMFRQYGQIEYPQLYGGMRF